jgi:hypothetical protein
MKSIDLEHLKDVGEGYFQHMATAIKYSFLFFACAAFCLFHAFFPFFFSSFASDVAEKIIVSARRRNEKS